MDFSNDRPIYLQIAEDIRSQILTGSLKAGSQIMSTTQYAATYRINPATANKAFALLSEEGIIEKRRGIGMFVTSEALTLLQKEGKMNFLEEYVKPLTIQALALGIHEDEVISLLRQSFSQTNTPTQEL